MLLALDIHTSETLTVTVEPSYATNTGVTWSVSNADDVVELSATTGATITVTAKAAGTATITVKTDDGGLEDVCEVEVKSTIAVTGVTLNKSGLTLALGGEETLIATVLPLVASLQTVSWSSNDNSIATVDSNGKVTANATTEGTATITVTTTDGNKTAECEVTVHENAIKVTGWLNEFPALKESTTTAPGNGVLVIAGTSKQWITANTTNLFGDPNFQAASFVTIPNSTGAWAINSTNANTKLNETSPGTNPPATTSLGLSNNATAAQVLQRAAVKPDTWYYISFSTYSSTTTGYQIMLSIFPAGGLTQNEDNARIQASNALTANTWMQRTYVIKTPLATDWSGSTPHLGLRFQAAGNPNISNVWYITRAELYELATEVE
jgi:hypothetical protein